MQAESTRPSCKGPAFFYAFTYADRTDWTLYGIGFVAAIISGAGFPILDLVYGYWTTALVAPDTTSASLQSTTNTMAGICIGIGILQLVTGAIFLSCFTIASGHTTDRFRRAYLDSVLHQDAEFFEKVGPGEVGTRMIKDIGMIKAATGEKLGFMVCGFTTLLVALIMAFSRAAHLAGVLVGVVPLAFILFVTVGYLATKADSRLLDVEGQSGTLLEQILGSIRVVQSFAAETFLVKKYDQYLGQLQRLGKWRSIVRGLELSISYCVLNLTYSVAFWYGSQLIVRDNLQVGLMFTVFWNMFNAIFAISNILPHISAIRDSVHISARIRTEIERVPGIDVRNPDGTKLWDNKSSEKTKVEIEVQNLTFSYPSRPDHKTLDNVSFVLEAGRVTALVGASGSGKSTIASLLLRYYDPSAPDGEKSSGRILLAGHDIRDLNLAWLRSQIGVIPQDPQLFTASIFENVAYGLSGTPWELPTSELEPNYAERLADARARVEEALKQAQAWDFVCKLPEGMDTRIKGGRTGVLSGGQRQRIAAARALIRKPRVLLLDEGTSALDAETEQRLMAAIHQEQAQTGMTTVLIAHRLSSIQNADRIIAMASGRVVEQGSYNELMELGGAFSSLVRHQASAGPLTPISEITVAPAPPRQQEPESSTAVKFTTPQLPLYRVISAVSVSQTIVDDSLERGLLAKGTEPPSLTSRFFRLLGRYGFWILMGIAGSICIGASFPISAWLVGFVVESMSIHDDDNRLLREARNWSMWFLVLSMVNIVSSFVAGFFLSMGGDRIDRRLRLTAVTSLLRQDIGFFDREENASGSLTAGIASQASNVSAAIGLVWQQLITSSGNFIGAFVLGVVLSWKLTLASYAPVPLILAAAYFNILLLEKYEHSVRKPLEDASAFASENVDAIKTVAALGRERVVMEVFDKSSAQKTSGTKYLWGGALGFGFGMGSALILASIVMWWGTELYVSHRIGLSNLYATFEAVFIGAVAASRLFTYVPDIARMIQGFRSICNWEDRQPEVASLTLANAPVLDKVRGSIVFNSCTLQYASRPKPAIDNLNLVIPAGKSVAFCGPSGSGKSSIISMISRFYDPSVGTILLDGRDIRSIPLEEYRGHISLVAQDAVLYEGTFRENITLGHTPVSQDEIERACRDANILDFIQSLPQGFDTSVGFKGSQMSGGQRQRICIARALLRNPSILLLDEATSALDAESERSVQAALEQASKGRTTVSIAHRLSTIQNADIIHVVEDGQIVESGSHSELLAINGRYVDATGTVPRANNRTKLGPRTSQRFHYFLLYYLARESRFALHRHLGMTILGYFSKRISWDPPLQLPQLSIPSILRRRSSAKNELKHPIGGDTPTEITAISYPESPATGRRAKLHAYIRRISGPFIRNFKLRANAAGPEPTKANLNATDTPPMNSKSQLPTSSLATSPSYSAFPSLGAAEESQLQADRAIRAEQDAAYERAQRLDHERLKKLREERLLEEERLKKLAELEEERRALEHKKAEHERIQNEWRRWARRTCIPKPQTENGIRFAVRLPCGRRRIGNLPPDTSLEALHTFVETLLIPPSFSPEDDPETPPEGYEHCSEFRLVTTYSRFVFPNDPNSKIRGLDIMNKGVLLIVEEIEELEDDISGDSLMAS